MPLGTIAPQDNPRRRVKALDGFVDNAAGRLGHRHGSCSIRRTRTVIVGFILPERDLLRDKEKPTSVGQRQANSTQR